MASGDKKLDEVVRKRDVVLGTVWRLEDDSKIIRKLWRHVILQALFDALNSSSEMKFVIMRTQAKNWFVRCGSDYQQVCELAGVDSIRVRARILNIILKYNDTYNDEACVDKISVKVNVVDLFDDRCF